LLGQCTKRRIIERVMLEDGALNRQPGSARFEKQVSTIEQQLAIGSVLCRVASEVAIAFDAGVRRSSHLESITDVLGSSRE
jgi:hypothetical protein